MPGPQDILKLVAMKNRFEAAHPKFMAFAKNIARTGVQEGSVIEVKVTQPDGNSVTANMKVTADDVAMINELKTLR